MTFYERKQGRCTSFYEKALYIDIYPRAFNFYLPGNQPRYRSLLGSVLSIATILAMLSYSTYKWVRLTQIVDY